MFEVETAVGETVLFICTANVCRSPMAEVLLRAELSSRCAELNIRSAGFLGEGSPADKKSVWAMEKLGIELTGHASTHVSTAVEQKPDLILVMAREHLRMLTKLHPDVIERAFTLKEFVRLATIEGERNPGEPLTGYIERVAAGRGVSAVTSPGLEEDVADPIGQRRAAFFRCASELKALVEQLSKCICPR
jgi:protein-tyrosine phosphatase